jgi:ferritin-like metal-binding protein YciE
MHMQNQFLHKLLKEEIQDLYSAEKQIIETQPQLIETASTPELKTALERHLDETNEQIRKLEEIASNLDIELNGKQCQGMKGIISEAKEDLGKYTGEAERDLLIIALSQRIEHFEIAAYGTARNYAQKMDHAKEAVLLDEIAKQKGQTDKKLTTMAEHIISREAVR